MLLYKVAFNNISLCFFQNSDDKSFFIKNKLINKKKAELIPGSGIDPKFFKRKKTRVGIGLKGKNFNIIIANTVKGYGIKTIANNPAWHHRAPTAQELMKFKKELKI